MKKEDVLAKLEEYKDRPIEIGLSDEGAMIYANIDGHWLFTDGGDNLVEIKKNSSDGTYGFSSNNQREHPFVITTTPFDAVMYVKVGIKNASGDIAEKTSGLTPVGTDKTLEEIVKAIESDSVRKANSPRGNLNTPAVAPGGYGGYGEFKGSAVSTTIDGVPQYMKDSLIKE